MLYSDRLLVLPANITLGLKILPRTTDVKSFIAWGAEVNVNKLLTVVILEFSQ